MFIVLFLLFQVIMVQSCNFDKGQFYHVLEVGHDGTYNTPGRYCSDMGGSEVPREWCMDVLTDNGRFSNDWSTPPPPRFQYISATISSIVEVYRLKYSREAAGHVTLMDRRHAEPIMVNGFPQAAQYEFCSQYNFTTGEATGCMTGQDLKQFSRQANTPMARPRGCSYNREGGQGEHGPTGSVIWRNATMTEGVADNPSPGGMNFGKCGSVRADEVAPTGWGLFYWEGKYTTITNEYGGEEEFYQYYGGMQRPTDTIDTKDVCICNRPGEDVPRCISDCPLKDHPDPEKYYGRCHPGKQFDSCECEFCINGPAPSPYWNQCKREGCMDSSAMNYKSSANVDDGSCIPVKVGCMFPVFENYDPEANSNDMSLCGEMLCHKLSDLAVDWQCCV